MTWEHLTPKRLMIGGALGWLVVAGFGSAVEVTIGTHWWLTALMSVCRLVPVFVFVVGFIRWERTRPKGDDDGTT